jgi:hypothetical protein
MIKYKYVPGDIITSISTNQKTYYEVVSVSSLVEKYILRNLYLSFSLYVAASIPVIDNEKLFEPYMYEHEREY